MNSLGCSCFYHLLCAFRVLVNSDVIALKEIALKERWCSVMELELTVGKRLSARVVFVVHFLFNILPVKRMFCT